MNDCPYCLKPLEWKVTWLNDYTDNPILEGNLIKTMICGHRIHVDCFNKYIAQKTSYYHSYEICPVYKCETRIIEILEDENVDVLYKILNDLCSISEYRYNDDYYDRERHKIHKKVFEIYEKYKTNINVLNFKASGIYGKQITPICLLLQIFNSRFISQNAELLLKFLENPNVDKLPISQKQISPRYIINNIPKILFEQIKAEFEKSKIKN